MKRKTSNILIIILAAIIVFCGVMALGTAKGWFSGEEKNAGNETAAEEQMQTEEQVEQEDSDAIDNGQESDTNLNSESQKTEQQTTKAARKCTITIKCDSILNNMDMLKEGKNKYVPSNGVILSKSTVQFKEGNTVYDVLKATCSAAGINLSARNSSMGIYVEGINNLFEFDCGSSSGWMYSVNGTAPNHGSGEHKVSNGDNIVWYYTCGN